MYVNFVGNEGEAHIRAAYPDATGIGSLRSKPAMTQQTFPHQSNIPPSKDE